jgi:predicted RNA methylase
MYDSWARYYDFVNEQSFGAYLDQLADRTLSFIEGLAPETARILDLGAGTSHLSIFLAACGRSVTAVELAQKI